MKLRVCMGIIFSQLLMSLTAMADDIPDSEVIAQIRQDWRCQWCPENAKTGSAGEVGAGVGYLSNDSAHFGDYNGIDEKGAYPLLSLRYQNRNSQGGSLAVTGDDLGLRSRRFSATMNNTSLAAEFQYTAMPHLQSDSARTPYQGGEEQTLPGSWVDGSSPQNMTDLNNALHDVDLYQLRRDYQVSLTSKPQNNMQYRLSFQQQLKNGNKSAGVAVGDSFAQAYAALLAVPIDSVTRQGELAAMFHRGAWRLNAAYAFSQFNNQLDALRFDYAYTAPNISKAQISLAPDNQMQSLSLSAQYQHSSGHHTSAQIALAQAKQSQAYLPYSLNSNSYPGDASLAGRIDFFDASIKHVVRLGKQMQLMFQYRDNEQDNATERQSFIYEIADSGTLSTNTRSNMPFGFRTQNLSALLDYQFSSLKQSLSAQVNVKQQDRTYQSVSKSRDNEVALVYKAPIGESWHFRGKLSQQRRNGSDYVALSELPAQENSLMRDYHLADRHLRNLSLWWSYVSASGLDMALQSRRSHGDYDAELGLQESREWFHALNMDYAITSRLNVSAAMDYFSTQSLQAGSQSYGSADWAYELVSRDRQARLALRYRPRWHGLVVGVEYSQLQSQLLADNTSASAFPDAKLKRQTLQLRADYDIDSNSQLHGYYRYQKYDEENWQRDAVAIDSLSRVLTLGQQSPVYDIGFLALSYSRRW